VPGPRRARQDGRHALARHPDGVVERGGGPGDATVAERATGQFGGGHGAERGSGRARAAGRARDRGQREAGARNAVRRPGAAAERCAVAQLVGGGTAPQPTGRIGPATTARHRGSPGAQSVTA
jgi:hypothetical protein